MTDYKNIKLWLHYGILALFISFLTPGLNSNLQEIFKVNTNLSFFAIILILVVVDLILHIIWKDI